MSDDAAGGAFARGKPSRDLLLTMASDGQQACLLVTGANGRVHQFPVLVDFGNLVFCSRGLRARGRGREWRGRDIAGLRAPHSLWQQDCALALQHLGKPGAPTASSAEARAIGSPGEPARWVGVGPSSRGLDSPTRSHGAWNFTAWDCSAGASSLSTISRRPGRQLAPRLEGRSQARWPRWDSAAMANSLRRPST